MVVVDPPSEDTYGVRAGSTEPVVLLFPGALGDLLLALPTIRHLRRRDDDAPFVVAVDRRWLPIARAASLADRVTAIDGPDLARVLAGGETPAWWGRARRLHAWFGAGDADVRRALVRHAAVATFARVVRGAGGRHAAVDYAWSVGWRSSWAELVAGARIRIVGDPGAFGAGVPHGVLVVHRGAGDRAKRWDTAGFARVARAWRDAGGGVVDLRGPADDDLPPLDAAHATLAPDVGTLGAALAAATAVVGNDSGPTHLAAAVGTPAVVVYGPTEPGRWRPLSDRVRVLRGAHVGAAWGDGVDPEAVVDAVAAFRG